MKYSINMLLGLLVFVLTLNQAKADLVGHWIFEGNANDSSAYANHGTLINDAEIVPNAIYGLGFNPQSGYVEIPDSNSLDITGSFTIEAWIKPNDLTGYKTIVYKNGHVYGWNLSLHDGKIFAEIGLWVYPTEKVAYSSNSTVSVDAWSHVVLTYDKNTIKCYINGIKDTNEVSETRNVRPNADNLLIGSWGGTSRYMSGIIDEVRIYNHALTETEVEQNYDAVVVNVKDFGATGLGIVDDAPAIRSAIASIELTGGIVKIPSGTYLIDSLTGVQFRYADYAFNLYDDIHLIGENGAVLSFGDNMLSKTTAGSGPCLILANEKQNVSVHNLEINMNGNNNLMPAGQPYMVGYAINFWLCENVIIENNTIIDTYGRNTILLGGETVDVNGNRGIVRNNTIINGGTSIIGNDLQNDYSAIYVDYPNSLIEGNTVTHTIYPFRNSGGIEIHGDNTTCIGNTLEKCHPGIYIAATYAGTILENIVVSNNTFNNVNRGIYFAGGGDFDNITISGNYINTFLNPNLIVPVCAGIIIPRNDDGIFNYTLRVNNLVIENNEFTEDFDDLNLPSYATSNAIVLSSVYDTTITNNIFNDITGAAVALRGCPYGLDTVWITYNSIVNFGFNTSLYQHNAIELSFIGSSTVPPKSAYDAENIYIQNNEISLEPGTGLTCYAFYFNWSDLSVVNNIVVSGNTLENINVKRGNKSHLVNVY